MSLRHFILATAALGALTAAPLAAKNPMVGGAAMYPTRTIVQNALNSKDHTTLVAAVKAAGLAETLSGAGPFTVFAPTNAAFGKLPAGTVEALLKDVPKLKQILLYHVAAGRVMAADVVKLHQVKTVQGQSLDIKAKDGVRIGKAAVVKADVAASNGVIHVIDTVLLPR